MSRSKRTLYLGKDTESGESVSLGQEWFETHLHLIGPPGRGKTRLLLHIFQHLSRDPNATIVLVNPKGALARMARDWTISQGQSKRLIWFDPGDPEIVMGYNPLSPNGRPIATHAKTVREAVRSAWGQSSFDQTPQLARLLYLSIAVSLSLGGTLLDAMRLLQSGPAGARVRKVLLAGLAGSDARGEKDLLRFLRDALAWFDSLGDRRQEELAASTLARLETFVSDPAVGRVLTQPRCVNLAELIAEHKILLVNLELGHPLCIDDVRLLGRFIVNDILNTVFSRPPSPNEPVYLILDEAHNFATHDLCSILDMGRELGLHCVLAHQNLGQLRREDEAGYVYDSVQGSALTKLYFGGLTTADLRTVVEDASIEQFDPYKVKDELRTLSLDPIESRREVVTNGWNVGISAGKASGKSRARSRVNALGHSLSDGESSTDSESTGKAFSSGHVSGAQRGLGAGETMLPNGEIIQTSSEIDGTSESYVDNQSDSYNETHTRGTNRSQSVQASTAVGESEGSQETGSFNVTLAESRSSSSTPFYEYEKVDRVSSRTFEGEQEYLTNMVRDVKRQPKGHAFLKVPGKPGRFLALPRVKIPWISERTRKAGMEKIFSQPFYSRRDDDPPEKNLLEDPASHLIGCGQPLLDKAPKLLPISEQSEVQDPTNEDEDFAGPEVPLKLGKKVKKKE